jgi:ribulose-phosphate 3-epimerase
VAPYVSLVQLDIMDGKFVKSRSWPYYSNDKYSFENLMTENEGLPLWDSLDYEIDLMVQNPEEVIDEWITAGARRLIVHIESTKKMDEIVRNMHERFAFPEGVGLDQENRAVELGIALNPSTPIDTILPYLEDIQFVQFMGIDQIGFQGQPFNEMVIDKIREFHNAHPEVVISIDGGVNFERAPIFVEVGVKRLVSGSVIFDSSNVAGAIEHFKNILE